MEVGQGPNVGCSAKGKKNVYVVKHGRPYVINIEYLGHFHITCRVTMECNITYFSSFVRTSDEPP
jgi:hypothetical protein